jgi:hypothetical protein
MPLTFHHLIPRETHRHLLKRAKFSKTEMLSRGASLCRSCHTAIHGMFDNRTLGTELNTMEGLLAREEVRRYREWKMRQPVRIRL